MKNNIKHTLLLVLLLNLLSCTGGEKRQEMMQPTADDAKVWTFWHWVHGAVSKEGLTADLEAMKAQGIGGAYIFAIRDTAGIYENQVVTYSEKWWDLVKYCVKEANRVGVELGFNACDGFTTAGGPWITPELSMQKVVWADTLVNGGKLNLQLPQPEDYKGYYEDIATYAYPVAENEQDSWHTVPQVSTNMKDANVQFLAERENTKSFSSKKEGYIQFAFDEPFSCQTIQIKTGWANYQSNRLIIQVSNDGKNFTQHYRLVPPRSGWQDLYQPNTQSIPPVTAKYYRFVFEKEGSEPGAEDLDNAKWSPKLALGGIRLLSSPRITQFEGKNASIWRIAESSESLLQANDCVPMTKLQNISDYVVEGKLNWNAPQGKWKIIRMGHTSTGRENYIGGGARGLECDKFNENAVKLQFNKWFGEVYQQVGKTLAKQTVTRLLCDSWECGSQNWSSNFAEEFMVRRGYDLLNYLPVMAGVPLESADVSERVLKDVRETVAELLAEKFSGTMAALAHEKGALLVEESNAPTGVVDGMLHHKYVDYPAGEFWFQSPSHDKPNDVLDAVSAAHIYGKPVVQAESFTEIRLDWNETPAMLKPYADRNLALGVNKIVNHVFVHNPWLDRKPGATLDKVGTFLQRDQTWWNMSSGFWDYLENCQSLLQKGLPVVDIAVFTGEEIPRRAVLPERLVNTLPGLYGTKRVASEKKRLANAEFPKYEMPRTVSTQANMVRPEDWIDPLRGYKYDSFNKDALLNLAQVRDGRIVLPSGMSYAVLVIPGDRKMNPNGGERMSVEVARKIDSLLRDGATIILQQRPTKTLSLNDDDAELGKIMDQLFADEKNLTLDGDQLSYYQVGKGKLLCGDYQLSSLNILGVKRDVISSVSGKVAWTHRELDDKAVYFLANQTNEVQSVTFEFRDNRVPVIYSPQHDMFSACPYRLERNGTVLLDLDFQPYESFFVLFGTDKLLGNVFGIDLGVKTTIAEDWTLQFNPDFGGVDGKLTGSCLFDWSKSDNDSIKYYSGEVIYENTFDWNPSLKKSKYWIDLGEVHNVAEVFINDKSIGVVWTPPYELPLANLQEGKNSIKIKVANTWNNRLIGDHNLTPDKQVTWTTAPYRLEGQPLIPAGLLGPVTLKSKM